MTNARRIPEPQEDNSPLPTALAERASVTRLDRHLVEANQKPDLTLSTKGNQSNPRLILRACTKGALLLAIAFGTIHLFGVVGPYVLAAGVIAVSFMLSGHQQPANALRRTAMVWSHTAIAVAIAFRLVWPLSFPSPSTTKLLCFRPSRPSL